MSIPEILIQTLPPCGLITLNRPQALNALTHGMVTAIAAALDEWQANPAITRVVIEAAGEKAFSAGGDIRKLYDCALAGDFDGPLQFWADEYRLNLRLKNYPKPCVALVDGLVMGGGAGVSLHASHVVAGDGFALAMPEVGIGFFPDVGATCFLSHLPGHWGEYLALTGKRVKAEPATQLGLAHASVASTDMAALKAALLAGEDVATAIARYSRKLSALAVAPWIETCFAAANVPQILQRLQQAAMGGESGAGQAAQAILAKCPTSLAVALRQMQQGRTMGLAQALQLEYRIVSRIFRRADFREGVRAVVIDKDNKPRWSPASLNEVSAAEVDAMFAPLPGGDLQMQAAAGQPT